MSKAEVISLFGKKLIWRTTIGWCEDKVIGEDIQIVHTRSLYQAQLLYVAGTILPLSQHFEAVN